MRFLEGIWVLILSHTKWREKKIYEQQFCIDWAASGSAYHVPKWVFLFTWNVEKRIIQLPVSNNIPSKSREDSASLLPGALVAEGVLGEYFHILHAAVHQPLFHTLAGRLQRIPARYWGNLPQGSCALLSLYQASQHGRLHFSSAHLVHTPQTSASSHLSNNVGCGQAKDWRSLPKIWCIYRGCGQPALPSFVWVFWYHPVLAETLMETWRLEWGQSLS